MKLTFSPKTICAIALITVTINLGAQRSAEAQAQPDKNACAIASAQLPSGILYGVNFSTEQLASYEALIKKFNDQTFPELAAKAKKVVKPNARIMFGPRQDALLTLQMKDAIAEAERSSKPDQIDSLNAEYSKYGRFTPETTLVADQALYEEFKKEEKALDDQIIAIMNPKQRQQYQQNKKASRSRDLTCGINDDSFTKVGNSYEAGGFFF